MVFLGIDWAEAHHDVCLLDEQGKLLGKRRVVDGLEGVRQLHELVAEQVPEPEQVVVGIDRPRLAGPELGGHRISGLRDQPAGGQPLP